MKVWYRKNSDAPWTTGVVLAWGRKAERLHEYSYDLVCAVVHDEFSGLFQDVLLSDLRTTPPEVSA